jgi:hypothetical protein
MQFKGRRNEQLFLRYVQMQQRAAAIEFVNRKF